MQTSFAPLPFRAVRVSALLVLILGTGASSAQGQALADPQVPAGRVRLDFVPSFWSWNTRYGLRPEGSTSVAAEEALGADLTDPVGTTLFPGIVALQEDLRALTGDASYQPKLGQTLGSITKEVTRIDTGLRLGIFDWLTLGANVPWVRGRTAVDVAFRPDQEADLGLNPTVNDGSGVSALLSSLESAALAAQAQASSVCEGGLGDACSQAEALAGQASTFRSRTEAAYTASPFFPTEASDAGASLSAALASLNAALGAAGLPGIGSGFVFANATLDTQGFASLATNPAAGFRGTPLTTVDGLWAMGDAELSASLRLLDGEVRESGAARPRLAYSVSGGALVRLGTGTPDDPDVFLDIGSGDGQMDVEGRVDGFIQVGGRLDLRGGFRYGVQNGVVLLRRVAPHEQILVPSANSRAVTWKPGSYTFIDVSPRYRLTPELSLAMDYRRYHKGADSYELVGEEPAGIASVDPSALAHETEMSLQEMALGLRYSTVRTWREGLGPPPMEMGLRLVRTVAGAGGQTPKATRFEFSASLFRRIWGRP
jgi:hypothetical protein